MDDGTLQGLDALAPDVDKEASRALFDRRRASLRARRRVATGALAAVVVVAGVVGAAAVLRDDDDRAVVAAGDPTTTDPSDGGAASLVFEVLTMQASTGDEMGALHAAVDAAELTALWGDAGLAGDVPAVDFEQWVVVSVTIPDDACPPELVRFDRLPDGHEGGGVTPVFVEPAGGCDEPLIPKTYVVLVDRLELSPGFTLRQPEINPVYGIEPHALEVVIPVACGWIEAFADQLLDTGITYDYDATESPAELAEASDLVVLGRLTGEFEKVAASGGNNAHYIAYVIEIDELLKGLDVPRREQETVLVEYNPAHRDPPTYGIGTAPGTPVIAFAYRQEVEPFGFVASIEGFATACAGQPPIGFVGTEGEWAGIATLDDLAAAVVP